MKMLIRAALAALFALSAAPAWGQDAKAVVDDAKSRCAIGEQLSGYLGEVAGDVGSGATAAEKAAMEEINIKRRAVYSRLAREQNVSLDVVSQLTGEKLINAATTGQCVKDSTGEWKKK